MNNFFITIRKFYLVLPMVVLLGLCFSVADVSAATKYWIGSGGGSFGDNANWSTSSGGSNDTTAPGSSDVASFDSSGNTSVSIDSAVNVSAIVVYAGYTETITQDAGSGNTITLGSGGPGTEGWLQSDGIFAGGDADITSVGDFNLSGGTFTSTSGTFTLEDDFTATGTFAHNSGTVSFGDGTTTGPLEINSAITFNNMILNMSAGHEIDLNGNTLINIGDYTRTSGYTDCNSCTATHEVRGDITIDAQSGAGTSWNTPITIEFAGGITQNFTINDADDKAAGAIVVNTAGTIVEMSGNDLAYWNTSSTTITVTDGTFDTNAVNITDTQGILINGGTFTHGSGTIQTKKGTNAVQITSGTYDGGGTGVLDMDDQAGSELAIDGGTFNAPSSLLIRGFFNLANAGATFNHLNGTVTAGAATHTDIQVEGGAGTITLYNLTQSSTGYSLDIAGATTLVVQGTLSLPTGLIDDDSSATNPLQLEGNLDFDHSTTGTAPLYITGTATQTLDFATITAWNTAITVNKAGGAVSLLTGLDLDQASNNTLTIEEGTFDINGQAFTADGGLVVEDGGNFQLQGDESISLPGAPTLNSGSTMTYDATSGSRAIADFSYHHLAINGSGGTFTVPNLTDDSLAGDLTITAGTLDLNGEDITVAGTFSNDGTLQLEGGETTVSLTNDTDSGTVRYKGDGSTAYSDLKVGDNYYNLIIDNAGNSWTLDAALDVNGDISITNGDVITSTNNVTVAGDWTVAGSYTAGSNTTTFDGTSGTQTIITGGTTANFDFNDVVINNSGTAVQLSINGMDIDGSLTITAGTLDINAQNLTSATFSNSGTLKLEGGETVTITNDTDSGLVFYEGDGSTSYGSLAVGDDYFDVEFDNASNTWTLDAALDVNGDLDITNGTLSSGGFGVTLAGDFTNADTFTHASGTITLDGTGQSIIGNTTFYDLVKSVSSADTLTFTATQTHVIANDLTLNGASGQLLSIITTSGGSAVNISVTGDATLSHLSVQDINNTGTTLQCTNNCTDVSGNTGWNFVAASGGGTPTPGAGPSVVVTTAMLLSPNGSQSIVGGSVYTITWSASGDKLSSIKLSYSSDGGISYNEISASEENDGLYHWLVPNIDTDQARVSVAAITSSGDTLIDDVSNSNFTISAVLDEDAGTDIVPIEAGPIVAEMLKPNGEMLDIREGSLFRGVELSGVYLVKNGTRYVFPSESVFLSYYPNFDGVEQVGDDQLRKLPFGGRMIMNEGELIKIHSDNRVYVVQSDGTLLHIENETAAILTYGDSWAQLVHDISVVFWFDYAQK